LRAANIANALADELIAESPAVQGQQADLQKAIQANLDSTQAEITQTQNQIDQLTAITVRTADQDQELQTLETRLVSLRATYAALVPSLNTNSSGLADHRGAGRAPTGPSSPRTLLNMLLAAVLGLLAAVGIASWPSIWTIRSRSSDEVQEVTGAANPGRRAGHEGRPQAPRDVSHGDAHEPAFSGGRDVSSPAHSIEFASVDAPLRTLLVTSSVPKEGKTTTAGNLAIVFAQAGSRVLLVDADLRKPGVHGVFGLPNQNGLTTLFRDGAATVSSVAQETELDNLKIITSGPLPPNPAEPARLAALARHPGAPQGRGGPGHHRLAAAPGRHGCGPPRGGRGRDGLRDPRPANPSRRVRQGREALAQVPARATRAIAQSLPVRVINTPGSRTARNGNCGESSSTLLLTRWRA